MESSYRGRSVVSIAGQGRRGTSWSHHGRRGRLVSSKLVEVRSSSTYKMWKGVATGRV